MEVDFGDDDDMMGDLDGVDFEDNDDPNAQ